MNISQISPTPSVHLADIARGMELNGEKIIKLQTGDPNFPTHPAVIKGAIQALAEGHTHYSFAQGLPKLREEIANHLNLEIETSLSEKNILITHGAAQGIYSILTSIIEVGDEVIVLEPNWTTIDSIILLGGGKPIKINFLESDIENRLNRAFTSKTRALCFNSPNNPTGTTLTQDELGVILDWAASKDIFIIADEVYRYLQYEKKSTSLSFIKSYEKYVFVDSFSKKYAMTGWRIGYVAAHESFILRFLKASQVNITNVSPFVQLGALEALRNEEVVNYSKDMLNEYRRRREYIMQVLNDQQASYIFPDGAFYFFIKLQGQDDVLFSNNLLKKNRVCVVPGSGYGWSGAGYIRISYSVQMTDIVRALPIILNSIIS